jgi:hypothetical protein
MINKIMRKLGNFVHFTFISFLFYSCSNNETSSGVQIKKLNYPSASAIEYYDGKLYVMGDDATTLLVLDTNLNIIDSILFISASVKRIPKDIKPDIEASAVYPDSNNIIFFGSGSLSPKRDVALRYSPKFKTKGHISLSSLYGQIKASGIKELNIEGACLINDKLILVNRGNKGYPHNQLIITHKIFWKKDSIYEFNIVSLETQKDTTSFKGISGLCYAKQSDLLIMTVSTENTRNSYDDGEIGKSYLWTIQPISKKIFNTTIIPDKIIDLEKIDPRFKKQKIESVTVIDETDQLINLVLVADNDDGSSTIFKFSLKKDTLK